MNYIKELNAFDRWLETNHLPGTSQLLWYKMVALFNRCGWAEWVTVDNQRLMALIQCKSEKTFVRARDNLIEKGLFVYRKGKKGSPNRYKMISFESLNTVNNTVDTTVFPTAQTTVYPPVETSDINKPDVNKNIKKATEKNPESVDASCAGLKNSSQNDQPDQQPDQLLVSRVIKYLNESCQTTFRAETAATRNLIKARENEGFVFEDFRAVIDTKRAEWLNDVKMNQYLRPQTLFGIKFESYLNQRKINHQGEKLNAYNYNGKGERSL